MGINVSEDAAVITCTLEEQGLLPLRGRRQVLPPYSRRSYQNILGKF
jgi:hypothetical protein